MTKSPRPAHAPLAPAPVRTHSVSFLRADARTWTTAASSLSAYEAHALADGLERLPHIASVSCVDEHDGGPYVPEYGPQS